MIFRHILLYSGYIKPGAHKVKYNASTYNLSKWRSVTFNGNSGVGKQRWSFTRCFRNSFLRQRVAGRWRKNGLRKHPLNDYLCLHVVLFSLYGGKRRLLSLYLEAFRLTSCTLRSNIRNTAIYVDGACLQHSAIFKFGVPNVARWQIQCPLKRVKSPSKITMAMQFFIQ